MTSIQSKGESMMASIAKQSQILGRLQDRAGMVERRRQTAEMMVEKLEVEKRKLESLVLMLKRAKDTLTKEMNKEETEIQRSGRVIKT